MTKRSEAEPKPSEYPLVKAGQWVQPAKSGYKMECCDCGLVHSLHFRIHAGRIQFKAYRDNRATQRQRRKRGKAL